MKKAKTKGLCLNYGPCDYHAEMVVGACSDSDGKTVPVFINKPTLNDIGIPDGHADLIDTPEGIVADVTITNLTAIQYIEALIISETDGDLKLGSLVGNIKTDKDSKVVKGKIININVSFSGLGDKCDFHIIEEDL